MKYLFLLIPALVLLVCCNQNQNGKYVTFDIQERDERFTSRNYTTQNESIDKALHRKLRNKKYLITYQKEFVILKDLEDNEEAILAKRTGADYNQTEVYYSTTIPKNKETFDVALYSDPTNTDNRVLLIDLIVPTGSITSIHGHEMPGTQYGRAVCYLSKLEEQ